MNFRKQTLVVVSAVAMTFGVTNSQATPIGHSLYAPGAIVAEEYELGPTSPGKWGSPTMGTGATVTWSYMPAGVSMSLEGAGPTVDLNSVFPGGWQTQIESAFAAWSAVANINFVQVSDDGGPFNGTGSFGDIRIGAHPFDGAGGVLAHGYYPPVNGTSAAGDIHFDSDDLWKIGFGGSGFDIFQVMAHEIGHAIGLAHTDVPNSLLNPFYTEAFSGPQADDIAGAQFIYGARVDDVPEVGLTGLLMGFALGALAIGRRKLA